MRYPMPNRNDFNNSRGGYTGNNNRDAGTQSHQPNQNSRGAPFTGRGGRFPAPPSRIQCQLCHRLGHIVLDCYYRFDKCFTGVGSNSTQQNQPQANLSQNTVSQDTNWYPDFGATNHYTPNVQNQMSRSNYHGPDNLYVGDGTGDTQNSPDWCSQEWHVFF
uniref:Uncharacterized protein n=1 Tax=Cannabis sativa TaxID=3483 RepID=A0A803P3N4_CANSA